MKGRGNREEETEKKKQRRGHMRGGTDSEVLLNQGFPFTGKKLYEVKQCRE